MQEIHKYIQGFNDFREEYFCCENSPFEILRKGQEPKTMVIACSDSRTDPSLLLQCGPGEIFVVRNVANIVPPYETKAGYHGVSSAIEYAVKALKVENIIVLGHSDCGGIGALMRNDEVNETEFVGNWLSMLHDVREDVLEHFGEVSPRSCKACEMSGVLASVRNLMTFPWIAERVDAGDLHLHAWYFDMTTGQLRGYDRDEQKFKTLEMPVPEGIKPDGD